MVEIEDGIEIPEPKGGVKRYPFDELEIGQSFVLESKGNSSVQAARKKYPDRKFTVRVTTEGVRVWRIA